MEVAPEFRAATEESGDSPRKRTRMTPPEVEEGKEANYFMAELISQVERALGESNTDELHAVLMNVMGFDMKDNPPSKTAAELLSKATSIIGEMAQHAALERIAVKQQQHTRHTYFGDNRVTVDSVVDIAGFLTVTEKYMLGSLSRSWKQLLNQPFMWPSLDPMPVSNFSKHADMKLFLSQNKPKFVSCKALQVPRVPSSSKLFKDIFAHMPQLCALSLHNVTGTAPLRCLVSAACSPERLMQLSFGLATKVSPNEVVCALKHFVNLRALELSFWHNEASFDVIGEAIGGLSQLMYLSLSQSFFHPFGYTLSQDRMNDDVFAHIAKSCPRLKDVHLSSFYAITNNTWKAFANHCGCIRSFSIEDCGAGIDKEGACALVMISPATMRYLAIFPRYIGNVSSFLPRAGMPYVSDDAISVIHEYRLKSPQVVLFTRRDPIRHRSVMFVNILTPPNGLMTDSIISGSGSVFDFTATATSTASSMRAPALSWPLAYDVENMSPCSDLSSLFGILIDSGTSGEAYYRHLVSIGHVAAFRMYMEQQLLPYSYFSNHGVYR